MTHTGVISWADSYTVSLHNPKDGQVEIITAHVSPRFITARGNPNLQLDQPITTDSNHVSYPSNSADAIRPERWKDLFYRAKLRWLADAIRDRIYVIFVPISLGWYLYSDSISMQNWLRHYNSLSLCCMLKVCNATFNANGDDGEDIDWYLFKACLYITQEYFAI